MQTNPWSKFWARRIAKDSCLYDPLYWSNTSREYDRKILNNNKLLRKLQKYVNSESTILDIEAGTGYPTLALASFVKKITAVER